MSDFHIASYWGKQKNNAVRCGLCPHRCNIGDNCVGLCGVRTNIKGELRATGYGHVCAIALDPIEKKPLYMFKPGKKILSIGGYGCNLHCPFCQNSSISMEYKKAHGHNSEFPKEVITPQIVKDIAQKTVDDGNVGVAYTYNEPLIGFEFLLDCAKEIRKIGLVNALVTNLYINEKPLAELLPYIDAINVDIKGYYGKIYNKVGGTLEEVKRRVEQAVEVCHVEVTTLIIPEENENDIEDIAKWISAIDPNIPYHLSRFFPRYHYSDRKPTTHEAMYRHEKIAKRYLKNVFLGNM